MTRTRPALILLLLAALAGVAALVVVPRLADRGGVKAPASVAPYEGSGPTVAIIGDSITFISTDAINAALRPHYATAITAIIGIKTDAQEGTAKRYAATKPAVAVINLGTNDVSANDPASSYKSELKAMVDRFPESCVVVTTMTTHTPGNDRFAKLAGEYNDYIRTFPHVADWDAVVGQAMAAGHNIMGDEVHPNDEGQRLYADLLASAVKGCG